MSVVQIHNCNSLSVTENSEPEEIEQRFAVDFPGMKCENLGSHEELHSAVEKGISNTLSAVSGCSSCKLNTVASPGCQLPANQKQKRAVAVAIKVLFSLVVFKDVNSSSSEDSVEEKSEAVLFQMQYAVAAGEFTISLYGMNTTALRSSLKHLSFRVTCSVGSVPSNSRKSCGEYLVELSMSLFILGRRV